MNNLLAEAKHFLNADHLLLILPIRFFSLTDQDHNSLVLEETLLLVLWIYIAFSTWHFLDSLG